MSEVSEQSKSRKALALRSSWLVRWALEAPRRWLGRRSTIAQDVAGGADGLSYLRHLVRGNRLRRRDAFDEMSPESPPVLIIHGFLGTLNVRDIRRSAFLIHRKIERILAQTPSQKIDIIGHSMGGLIGLYYVKKLGGHARVRKLIMMGTPVRGTWAALAGVATLGLWSTSSWQLLPRSRFLDELAQGPIPPGVEVHTIAAARDWVVPLATTRLTGASASTVPLGHSSLVVSEEVYRRVVHTLRPPHEHLPEQDPAATD